MWLNNLLIYKPWNLISNNYVSYISLTNKLIFVHNWEQRIYDGLLLQDLFRAVDKGYLNIEQRPFTNQLLKVLGRGIILHPTNPV